MSTGIQEIEGAARMGLGGNAMQALDKFEPDIDMALDAGIRDYVLRLRSEGIETFESCEGGEGHSFLEPTVRFCGGPHEGFKAVSVALMYGLPVTNLRRYYRISGQEMEGPWWEMTFRTTA